MESCLFDIILCDDHHISLLGIETVIRQTLGENISIRRSTTGEEALQLFQEKEPQLLILDLSLPQISGLDVIKSIQKYPTECKIIVLSGSEDPSLFQLVMGQKVNAVLRKLNTSHNLIEALDHLKSNESTIYLDPSIEKIIKGSDQASISNREYEVLELMSQGHTSQEIADKLNCTLPTIKTYRARMMNKTGARNSSELLAWFLSKRNIKRNSSSQT